MGNVVYAAMGQAFFTLSLGIGAMAIFGSYIGGERTLLSESVNITLLDTFVALMAGLIIFPPAFPSASTRAGPRPRIRRHAAQYLRRHGGRPGMGRAAVLCS